MGATTAQMDLAITAVELQVKDREAALAFYRDLLGFAVVETAKGATSLAAAPGQRPLLRLVHSEAFHRPRGPRTGLYHTAFLLPSRADLGALTARLLLAGTPLQGASDHHVSEALYLADPDGNGVELYADRPREGWQFTAGQLNMRTRALDLPDLLRAAGFNWDRLRTLAAGRGRLTLSQLPPWQLPSATRIGHLHLSVGQLAAAEQFYHHGLGLAVTARHYPGALFFAADGYHHHLGANVWQSAGAAPPPADATGLVSFSLSMTEAAVEEAAQRLGSLGHAVTAQSSGFSATDADGIQIFVQARTSAR